MSAALDKDDGIVGCWSCHGPVAGRALFCHTCGAVQPPGQIDHFARLGLDRDFQIDGAELDRRYFGFQRNLHPDRFARRSAKERAIAESQSASLNQAYETLKEPLSRAAYLLELAGIRSAAAHAATVDDEELLTEAMENREALMEAETLEAVDGLTAKALASSIACLSDLGQAFHTNDLERANRLATRLRYWRKLGEEARGKRRLLEEMPA
ncbi:MAG TPA: Fe-S protein assembly co-chaperone HscB [Dongiaceae bacterium]|jgi:molecular chaperone HscB|nr:Fe-S protein assembly co-chaperone HscB [Dongiaceae bacterium]